MQIVEQRKLFVSIGQICVKSIFLAETEYPLNLERLNIDSGTLCSECHAWSGLGDFSDFPTQRHAIAPASIFHYENTRQGCLT